MKHEDLLSGLKKLYLHQMASDYVEASRVAEKEKKTYEQYLAKLVEIELHAKHRQKVGRLARAAKMPLAKKIETYNFDMRTGITVQEFKRLATGDFVRENANVVFYGGFGMGKTHLATALIESLCEAGIRCLFTTAHGLINQLVDAKRDLTLTSLLKRLDKFDVIVCDELGYVPHDPCGADLFFQLISQRAERKSTVITTNLTFSEWEQVFINPKTTAAAVDRIIFKCETYNIAGNESFRSAEAKKSLKNKISLQNVSL
jgi:DNA replication protein DnaC